MFNTPIYWAHFNAEQAWQDSLLARLPAVVFSKNRSSVPLLDEIYRPDGSHGIALTLTPQDPILTQFHQTIGINIHRESLFSSVGEWCLVGCPDWPSIFNEFMQILEHHTCDRLLPNLKLLQNSPQKPFAVVADIAKLNGDILLSPSVSQIIDINSKTFITELCQTEGVPCEGIVIRTAQQLSSALMHQRLPFVIKEAFGVSGKGSLVVKDTSALQQIERYLLKQVEQGKVLDLLIQPWLDKALDFSSQWAIDEQGQQHLLGLSRIHNEGFKFIGAEALPDDIYTLVENSEYFYQIRVLLKRVSQLGYVGPLGIDSMLLTDGAIYPVVEINARETMGSIAQRWFNSLGKTKGLILTQWDIAYKQPIDFSLILASFKQQNKLFSIEDYSGVLPLTTASLQLPCYDGRQIGRWFQIHRVDYDREELAHYLDVALAQQGASRL